MKVFFLLLIIFYCVNIAAQTNDDAPLFPIWDEKKGKTGFMDINGRVVIKPQFDEATGFSEGLAKVRINDRDGKGWIIKSRYGYINKKGEQVVPIKFEAVGNFSEGLAAVRFNYTCGYVDTRGQYVIPPEIESLECGPFSEGLAGIRNLYCGYINKKGQYVIAPKASRNICTPFSEGLAWVEIYESDPEFTPNKDLLENQKRGGYLDKQGNWAIKPVFYDGISFKDGMALVQKEAYPLNLWYLIDKTGQKVSVTKDCRLRPWHLKYAGEEKGFYFSEGLAWAYSAKKQRYDGVINENCEYVFKLPTEINNDVGCCFSEGLAVVHKDVEGKRLYGYIDRTGKVVIPFQFIFASPFSEGLAVVRKNDKGSVYINRDGKVVIEKESALKLPPRLSLNMSYFSTGLFKNGLALQHITFNKLFGYPIPPTIYGYMNKQGKYVWLSPHAAKYLKPEWIQRNYIGAELPANK